MCCEKVGGKKGTKGLRVLSKYDFWGYLWVNLFTPYAPLHPTLGYITVGILIRLIVGFEFGQGFFYCNALPVYLYVVLWYSSTTTAIVCNELNAKGANGL